MKAIARNAMFLAALLVGSTVALHFAARSELGVNFPNTSPLVSAECKAAQRAYLPCN